MVGWFLGCAYLVVAKGALGMGLGSAVFGLVGMFAGAIVGGVVAFPLSLLILRARVPISVLQIAGLILTAAALLVPAAVAVLAFGIIFGRS